MALQLFHEMAARVPAYQKFLAEHSIKPSAIITIEDFKTIPPVDKDNYLRKYPRHELCWDGQLKEKSWVISTTSGSTGEPFYFPRQDLQDQQYALMAELYLRNNFNIPGHSTLYIDAFPMGAWIGGVFTYEAIKKVAETDRYRLSIITPGINKLEVIKAVKNLGAEFDQIIIGAYGPFLKDIIDDGIAEGLNWKNYNLGFVLSAEAFSETFRDYIAAKTGLGNIYLSMLNHYGTVDLGTMSYETPLAVLLRRTALENEQFYERMFSQAAKLPTLTQFLPELFYFEAMNGNLLCSAYSGLPLVRYDLKDHGGIFTYDQMTEFMAGQGTNLEQLIGLAGIKHTVWQLPFVYVYERSDLSVSFFAFQIYPESIRKALLDKTIQNYVTGKFTMLVDFDKNSNQYFEINIELMAQTKPNAALTRQVSKLIIERLLHENSEYRKVYEDYGAQRVKPNLAFWPYGDPKYFMSGTKQKWVKK